MSIEWVEGRDAGVLARRVRQGHVGVVIALEALIDHGALNVIKQAARGDVPIAYGNRGGCAALLSALRELNERLTRSAA